MIIVCRCAPLIPPFLRLMKPAMRILLMTLLVLVGRCSATAQQPSSVDEVPAGENPFGTPADAGEAEGEWTPTHPDGDTPQDRMLALAHTDALPRFDRVELYALTMPAPFDDEEPKRKATSQTFPVRPYGLHADVQGHATLKGDACQKVRSAWQSLTFDRTGGSFCHYPVYGFRLYRGDDLLMETTVCWQCQNFYVPRYDSEKRGYTHGWYGFANDDHAKSLLKLFQGYLAHPKK